MTTAFSLNSLLLKKLGLPIPDMIISEDLIFSSKFLVLECAIVTVAS